MQQMMATMSSVPLADAGHEENSGVSRLKRNSDFTKVEPSNVGVQTQVNKVGELFFRKGISIKIDLIAQGVAKYFGLKLSDLKAVSRTRTVVFPRQIAIYLIRKHTSIGFKEIGRCFGGQDHTTVMHAFRKVTESVERHETIREVVLAIESSLIGDPT